MPSQPDFSTLIARKDLTEFREAAWDLFNRTGQFVAIDGTVFTAPRLLKKRPVA